MNRPQPPQPTPGATEVLKTLTVRGEGRDAGVLRVELNQPETGNAVTEVMLDELLLVLTRTGPRTRVVVLTGAGEDFCLGGDRGEFADMLDDDPSGDGIRASGHKARLVCDLLGNHQAVTIAAVHGRTIGAGFALALACDLRIGTPGATFRLPELALGLPPSWGGLLPRLVHEIGAARVRDLVLTGRVLGAEEAHALAVLQRIAPEAERESAINRLAGPILRRPRPPLALTKTLLAAQAAQHRMGDTALFDAEIMAAAAAATRQRG